VRIARLAIDCAYSAQSDIFVWCEAVRAESVRGE
jgi:hypothetical protein